MSAYVTCKTQYRDRESLVKALEDLGFVVEVHNEAQPLHGYKRTDRTAQIVVRKGVQERELLSDIGFQRQSDGTYLLVASDYDMDESNRYYGALGVARQGRLKARYAYHQVIKTAKAKGYNLASEKSSEGKTKLVLRRFA